MADLSLFQTSDGTPVPAVTADEMRDVDRVAIDDLGPNLYQMMENAGRNLAETAIEMLGDDWRTATIVILAGTGGNGGGGIVAGRHLANRGADVLLACTDRNKLNDVPAQQLRLFSSTDGRLVDQEELAGSTPGLIIDAIIGYSLKGAPRGVAQEMIEFADASAAPSLCLDTPSGLDATAGQAPGAVVTADRTLTLALPKIGLAASQAGEVWLGDIGIPAAVYDRVGLTGTRRIFDHRYRLPLYRR